MCVCGLVRSGWELMTDDSVLCSPTTWTTAKKIAVWGWAKSSLQQIVRAGGRKTPDCEKCPESWHFRVLSGRLEPTRARPGHHPFLWHGGSAKNTWADAQRSQEKISEMQNYWKNMTGETFNCRKRQIDVRATNGFQTKCYHSEDRHGFSGWNDLRFKKKKHHIYSEESIPLPPTWQKHCIMRGVFWGPHFSWASLQAENLIFLADGNLFYSGTRDAPLYLCAFVNVLCGRMCVYVCECLPSVHVYVSPFRSCSV